MYKVITASELCPLKRYEYDNKSTEKFLCVLVSLNG